MKIILEVNCANEWFDDAANVFIAEIGEEMIERIRRLAEVVKENECFRIEQFDYTGEYYEFFDFDKETDPEELIERIEKECEPKRTECNVLRVMKDKFDFACYPKHCGSSERLNTESVNLEDLDKPVVFDLNCC